MKATALTLPDATRHLQVELIANGRGTQAVHETVVAYRANRRAGTHSVKTKATVNLSGKKPWKQKGTGRARAGYASSPIWRGGGVVFGPHPRDYSKKTPKKVKQLALKKALSVRAQSGGLMMFDQISLSKPKTKELVALLAPYRTEKESLLLVLAAPDASLHRAARNHPRLETTTGAELNAEQILKHAKVLVSEAAFSVLAERLKKSSKSDGAATEKPAAKKSTSSTSKKD